MRRMIEHLIALAVPPRCAACGAAGRRPADVLCAGCRRALPWLDGPCCARCALPLPRTRPHRCPAHDAPFAAAWSAVAYDGPARAAMHALKFAAARPLAAVMAAQIAANAPPALLPADAAIVAVPAHPLRRRARGYDPAELIARALARRCGREPTPALERAAVRARQLGASAAQRRAPGGVHVTARARSPARVILVDDVHTTGATLAACAAALRAAGCEQVIALTWARALDLWTAGERASAAHSPTAAARR